MEIYVAFHLRIPISSRADAGKEVRLQKRGVDRLGGTQRTIGFKCSCLLKLDAVIEVLSAPRVRVPQRGKARR